MVMLVELINKWRAKMLPMLGLINTSGRPAVSQLSSSWL
jgi:hypothetical protein